MSTEPNALRLAERKGDPNVIEGMIAFAKEARNIRNKRLEDGSIKYPYQSYGSLMLGATYKQNVDKQIDEIIEKYDEA